MLSMNNTGYNWVSGDPEHFVSEMTGEPAVVPPAIDGVVRTRFLFESPNKLPGYDISIREQTINDLLSPDVATIVLNESTPVQMMTGENQITEIFISTLLNVPIGIVLMDPSGRVFYDVYDPLVDGGPHGYTISKDWMMQTIVGDGGWLQYLDYWNPRGYCEPVVPSDSSQEGSKTYGETVVVEVKPEDVPESFLQIRSSLQVVIDSITRSRIGDAITYSDRHPQYQRKS